MISQAGLRVTANRLLVARALAGRHHPMSLAEVETELDTVDRSVVFRCLTAFAEAGVTHVIDDGSGSLKYELCHHPGHCTPAEQHVHFYCTGCHSTTCLESVRVPEVVLPEGYRPQFVSYLVKGLCPACQSKHT